MAACLTIPMSRGFDAQGVWAPMVVSLPLPEEAAALKSGASSAWPSAPAAPAPAIPLYLGEADPSPKADAPVLVASLKAMAVLVALVGAYLSGLFLLGSPASAVRPAITAWAGASLAGKTGAQPLSGDAIVPGLEAKP